MESNNEIRHGGNGAAILAMPTLMAMLTPFFLVFLGVAVGLCIIAWKKAFEHIPDDTTDDGPMEVIVDTTQDKTESNLTSEKDIPDHTTATYDDGPIEVVVDSADLTKVMTISDFISDFTSDNECIPAE